MQGISLFKKSAQSLLQRMVRCHQGLDVFIGIYDTMSAIRDRAESGQLSLTARMQFLDATCNFLQKKVTHTFSDYPAEALRLKQSIERKKDGTSQALMRGACLTALKEMKREIAVKQKGFLSKTEFDQHGNAFGGSIGRMIVLSQNLPNPEKEMKAATSLGQQVWAIHVLGKARDDLSTCGITSFPFDVLSRDKQNVFLEETQPALFIARKAAQDMHDHLVPSQNDYASLAKIMPDGVSRFVVAACTSLAKQGMANLKQGLLPRPSKKRAVLDGLQAVL